MRGEYQEFTDSVVAEGAITDRAVVVQGTSEGQGKIAPSTNSDGILGIAQAAADDTKSCSISRKGVREVIAAGAISIGDLVITSGALGRVETLGTLSPGTASIKYIVGEAQSAASIAGDILEVLQTSVSRHYAA